MGTLDDKEMGDGGNGKEAAVVVLLSGAEGNTFVAGDCPPCSRQELMMNNHPQWKSSY